MYKISRRTDGGNGRYASSSCATMSSGACMTSTEWRARVAERGRPLISVADDGYGVMTGSAVDLSHRSGDDFMRQEEEPYLYE